MRTLTRKSFIASALGLVCAPFLPRTEKPRPRYGYRFFDNADLVFLVRRNPSMTIHTFIDKTPRQHRSALGIRHEDGSMSIDIPMDRYAELPQEVRHSCKIRFGRAPYPARVFREWGIA